MVLVRDQTWPKHMLQISLACSSKILLLSYLYHKNVTNWADLEKHNFPLKASHKFQSVPHCHILSCSAFSNDPTMAMLTTRTSISEKLKVQIHKKQKVNVIDYALCYAI